MPEQSSHGDARGLSSLRGRRVLVVEDEYSMAEDLRHKLEGQGAVVLGPVPAVAEALDLLSQKPAPDFAILDVNLQGETVYPVVDGLRAQGIPCIFATGYDLQAIPPAYANVPRAEKPVEIRQLQAIIRS